MLKAYPLYPVSFLVVGKKLVKQKISIYGNFANNNVGNICAGQTLRSIEFTKLEPS